MVKLNAENCVRIFMKKLLGIVVLSLFLITTSWADDIRDFQIEGISIGDSLLDYYDKEKINSKKNFNYKNKKFASFYINENLKIYDEVEFNFIDGDERFVIHGITGTLNFDNQIKKCLVKKQSVVKELKNLFNNKIEFDYENVYDNKNIEHPNSNEKFTSKNIAFISDFDFENKSAVRVWCVDWSDEVTEHKGWIDNLNIKIQTGKWTDWSVSYTHLTLPTILLV